MCAGCGFPPVYSVMRIVGFQLSHVCGLWVSSSVLSEEGSRFFCRLIDYYAVRKTDKTVKTVVRKTLTLVFNPNSWLISGLNDFAFP